MIFLCNLFLKTSLNKCIDIIIMFVMGTRKLSKNGLADNCRKLELAEVGWLLQLEYWVLSCNISRCKGITLMCFFIFNDTRETRHGACVRFGVKSFPWMPNLEELGRVLLYPGARKFVAFF